MHTPVSVSKDGNYSIEFVECLASCGTAPVCMVQDELFETVQPEDAPLLLNPKSKIENPKFAHPLEHRLIFKNIGRSDYTTDIDCYLRNGGDEQLKKGITSSRTGSVNKVKT